MIDSDRLLPDGEKIIKNGHGYEAKRKEMGLPDYVKTINGNGQDDLYHEINPSLNTEVRLSGINALLSQTGYKVGFSNGYFVFNESTGIQTATGVEAEQQRTIQFIQIARWDRKQASMARGAARKNTVANSGKSGKIEAGAVSGAYNNSNDPQGKNRDEHAKRYYESMRNSQKLPIVNAISNNAKVDSESVSKMYDHLLINEHEIDGKRKMFDPDYYIAESIQRLREGKNIQEHDLLLIGHEALEHDLMENGKISYQEAHEIANMEYNYEKSLEKWIDENE